jgi:hypothetical protein
MKALLTPLYFDPGRDEDFDTHLDLLKDLLADNADFTEPVALGGSLPACDAVIFPQMLGEAYRRVDDFRAIEVPILVVTSNFGTVNMWDWEIVKYLDLNGVQTICPPSLEATQMTCRGLAVKRRLNEWKFVVYQDDPAGPTGKQSEIFKRFYWLEKESTEMLERRFGLKIEQRSFRELGKRAAAIRDEDAQKVIDEWPSRNRSVQGRPLLSAVKLYMELDRDYKADDRILAMGLNCLNESSSCDTTPCLAWNLLYEREHLVWGCEADTLVMMTEVFVDKVIEAPFFMTNLYPFIMGKAALSHERIPHFPEVDEPENHMLAAHCGYFGLLPEKFSTQWQLRNKVLAMVDDNATMIDAQLPTGPITLVKLEPYLNKVSISEAELTGYIQYEDSDCLNGGIIRVKDGRNFVEKVASHHYVVVSGHQKPAFGLIARIFNFELEEI